MEEQQRQVFIQGLVAGAIGYFTVVILFAVLNLVAGESPFYTPAALGSALFYGLRDPSELVIAPGPVLAYNGVHVVVSLLVGFAASWLTYETERHHALWYLLFFLFLAGFIYSVVAVGIVGAEIAGVVPWWSVVASNVAWVITMGAYLLRAHRGLLRELRAESASER